MTEKKIVITTFKKVPGYEVSEVLGLAFARFSECSMPGSGLGELQRAAENELSRQAGAVEGDAILRVRTTSHCGTKDYSQHTFTGTIVKLKPKGDRPA